MEKKEHYINGDNRTVFKTVLSDALAECDKFSLLVVIQNGATKEFTNFLKEISPFLIKKDKNPTDHYLAANDDLNYEVWLLLFNDSTKKILEKYAQCFSDFCFPDLPEDITFYKNNNDLYFKSVSHESLFWIYLNDKESEIYFNYFGERRFFKLKSEELYKKFLTQLAQSCDQMSFIFLDNDHEESNKHLIAKMKNLLISRSNTDIWPGKCKVSSNVIMYKYKYNTEMIDIIITEFKLFTDLLDREGPNDICIYRKNSDPFLIIVSSVSATSITILSSEESKFEETVNFD